MKDLKNHTIPQWDDFSVSYLIKGAEWKDLEFCIRDNEEELYCKQMEREDNVYSVEIEEDVLKALETWEYIYSVRTKVKPKKTVGKGIVTLI